jgi:hypothetical protein
MKRKKLIMKRISCQFNPNLYKFLALHQRGMQWRQLLSKTNYQRSDEYLTLIMNNIALN